MGQTAPGDFLSIAPTERKIGRMAGNRYRDVRWGVEALPAACSLPRHRHRGAYANVVLAGSFVEASFAGRFRAEPGQVLLHGSFDCHSNDAFKSSRPEILRLPWFDDAPEGCFRVRDPESLVRVAAEDANEAARQLRESLEPIPGGDEDWPELLASALGNDASLTLSEWADLNGIAHETVSRGFGRAFGVTPKLFRLEARTRRAWRAVVTSSVTLTDIAHREGFADLAHMSRSIRDFTNASPTAWRGQVRSSALDAMRSQ